MHMKVSEFITVKLL